MGRYYTGDIEGKFWFAVQSSDDANFFGVEGWEPSILKYEFDKSNLPDIEEGIDKCEVALGGLRDKFDTFFKENNGYTDPQLAKYLDVDEKELKGLQEWYARLELGLKIRDCVKKTGQCYFEAEL